MAAWYLSQEFSPDTPGSQVFVAPGADEDRLTPDRSPWVHGRVVELPGRYWHLLLQMIAEDDPGAAEVLDRWSGTPDPDDPGQHLVDVRDVELVESAMHVVSHRLRSGAAVSDADLAALGPYTRGDMAGMLDAVILVVDAALSTAAPFEAWPE